MKCSVSGNGPNGVRVPANGVAVIFSLFTHTRPETPHTRHDFYTEAKHYKHFAQTKSYVPSYDVS